MPQPIVVHRSLEDFQQQYGTLWRAVETYLDGNMPDQQAAALERCARPEFFAAVAQTRLFAELVAWVKQA